MNKGEILSHLFDKNVIKNRNASLSGIDFSGDDKEIIISISTDNCMINMQNDNTAFESWAIIFKTFLCERIYLKVKDIQKLINYNINFTSNSHHHNGHLNRFLYRVAMFKQSYPSWFKIDDDLQILTNLFIRFLNHNTSLENRFCLEEPKGKQGEPNNPEAKIEKIFSDTFDTNLLESDKLYRHLPIGLFFAKSGEKKNDIIHTENQIFLGGSAAIDLWGLNLKNNAIQIYELKEIKNNKLGIIAEIMFYAIIILGLLPVNNTKNIYKWEMLEPTKNMNIRGYSTLYQNQDKLKHVNAFMLLDKNGIHSSLQESVFKTLNNNKSGITYGLYSYDYDKNSNKILSVKREF